ncbi:MAG: hypothetical protein MUQ10_20360 [Anaerolineae bacterium]|nr:hypothetical protein [Anaerolineae bacterium]
MGVRALFEMSGTSVHSRSRSAHRGRIRSTTARHPSIEHVVGFVHHHPHPASTAGPGLIQQGTPPGIERTEPAFGLL